MAGMKISVFRKIPAETVGPSEHPSRAALTCKDVHSQRNSQMSVRLAASGLVLLNALACLPNPFFFSPNLGAQCCLRPQVNILRVLDSTRSQKFIFCQSFVRTPHLSKRNPIGILPRIPGLCESILREVMYLWWAGFLCRVFLSSLLCL